MLSSILEDFDAVLARDDAAVCLERQMPGIACPAVAPTHACKQMRIYDGSIQPSPAPGPGR